MIGDDVGGIAVHIGARVGCRAGPGEVLVSGTVKDLVVGSGIEFEDRGERELRGVPGDVAAVGRRRLTRSSRRTTSNDGRPPPRVATGAGQTRSSAGVG